MYLKLKSDYIIKNSPTKPMLINTSEDTQFTISHIESIILGLLDGTKEQNTIHDIILSKLQTASKKERQIVITNIDTVIDHFSDYIDISPSLSLRKNFIFGDLEHEYPYELSIELTNSCLLECKHCYKEASSCKHTTINTTSLISFLEQARDKVHTIQLTGGEAMLHPDFWKILDYCKMHFKEVVISTTGLLINQKNIDKLKNTKIYLSLYSFNSQENQNYVGKDILDKVLSAVTLLKSNNIHVCINTIVSDNNVASLTEFIKKCEEINVDGVGLGKNVSVGRAKTLSNKELCSKECEQCVKEIADNFSSNQMYLSTFLSESLPKDIQCGYYKWIINEKGLILPCAFFPEQFAFGNICDPIELIFNQQKFDNMILNLKKLAFDMRANGSRITDICEVLYLVEENEVTD